MTFERARIVMDGFFGKSSDLDYLGRVKCLPPETWKNTTLYEDYNALYGYSGKKSGFRDCYDRWLQSLEKWIRITYSGQWRDVMTESVRDVLNGRVDHLIRYDISDPE